MSNGKATTIFLFFFVIPYVTAQTMVGIAYNALVLHSDSLWRSVVGAVVGATLLYFAKIPLERPLRILGKYTTIQIIHYTVRFFMLQEAKWWKISLNYLLDVGVALFATYALRTLWPGTTGKAFLMGTPFGWCLALLFISLCIGAYIDFDALSLVKNIDRIENK